MAQKLVISFKDGTQSVIELTVEQEAALSLFHQAQQDMLPSGDIDDVIDPGALRDERLSLLEDAVVEILMLQAGSSF